MLNEIIWNDYRDTSGFNSAAIRPLGTLLPPINSTADTTAPVILRPPTSWEIVTRQMLTGHPELWRRLAAL